MITNQTTSDNQIFIVHNHDTSIKRTDIDEKVEIFTQCKFKELIEAKFNEKKSYVLAVVKDTTGKFYEYDGERFFSFFESTTNHKNPLTNLTIESIDFWEFTKNGSHFFAKLPLKSEEAEDVKKAIEYLVWANEKNEKIEKQDSLLRERWLGLKYMQANNYDQAQVYLSRSAERDDPVSIKLLALIFWKANDVVKSMKWLKKFNEIEPNDIDMTVLLAMAYEMQSNNSSAFKLYLSSAEKGNTMSICKVIDYYERGLAPSNDEPGKDEEEQKDMAKAWRAKLPESLQNQPVDIIYQDLS